MFREMIFIILECTNPINFLFEKIEQIHDSHKKKKIVTLFKGIYIK